MSGRGRNDRKQWWKAVVVQADKEKEASVVAAAFDKPEADGTITEAEAVPSAPAEDTEEGAQDAE